MPVKNVFLSLSAQNHTISDIYIRDIFPENPPNADDLSADWQFSQISFTAGQHRAKKFDWAFSVGFAFDKFLDETAYAFIMNGGFLWKLLDDDLRFGLAFNNFGNTTPMINENGEKWGGGEKLPTSIKSGAAYSWKIKSVDFCAAGDILYWHLYDQQEGKVANFGKRLQVPLGLEISPANFIAVRGGKTLLADYNVVNFGIGINTKSIDFDIAAAINKYETSVELEWIAGISLAFGSVRDEGEIKK